MTNITITVQGGDCTIDTLIQNPATLSFNVNVREDAIPGLRDIRMAYADSNAIPVVKKDEIEILKVGCEGSRLHFHTVFAFGSQYPSGMPAQDEVANDKQFIGITGASFLPLRMWMWDIGDQNAPGATALFPRWDATDATTAPDINNTVASGKECTIADGYLVGDPSEWFTPLVPGSYQCSQWSLATGAKAYALAPDEMAGQSGGVVPEQKWQGFPAPLVNYIFQMTDIPVNSFFRKPMFYMGTGDHFWSNAKLADPTRNQTWAGAGGGNQTRFTALPMWFRGTNAATFDSNYGFPFIRLRALEQGPNFFGYNPLSSPTQGDTSPQAEAKGIMMLAIEPIECVLPGPQTKVGSVSATDFKQKSVYRRRENSNDSRGKATLKAKIKVLYQDLWAFSDYYGGAGVSAGNHIMADPIVVAEAYCPRIDVSWDFEEWNTRNQPTPNPTPALDPDCRYPKITMESEVFEWKRILKRGDQVEVKDSSNPADGAGKFLDPTLLSQAADLFMKEFDGYGCRLVVTDTMWSPLAAPNADQQWFSAYTGGPGRAYTDDLFDREGAPLAVSGYIEVVAK